MSGIPRTHLMIVGGIGLAVALYVASVLSGQPTPVLKSSLAGTQLGKPECKHSHHSTHTQVSPVRCPVQPDVRNVGGEWILTSAADKQQAYERLAAAIRIRTESFDDMPMNASDPVFDVFYEFEEYLRTTFPLFHKATKFERVNTHGLLFTWEGTDESLKPMILMAHQDVVPVNEVTWKFWTHPPFDAYMDNNGWVWGRGTTDMKSTLVALMSSAEKLMSEGFQPERTILYSFGFDEEIRGPRGAGHLAQHLLQRYGRDGAALVFDEGFTGVDKDFGQLFARVGLAEKGCFNARLTVMAPGGHSSRPPLHTGIGIMGQIFVAMEETRGPLKLEADNTLLGYLECAAVHGSVDDDLKQKVRCPECWPALADELASDGAKELFLRTTQAITIVNGGNKYNALPEYTTALANYRTGFFETSQVVMDRLASAIAPIAAASNMTFDYQGSHAHVRDNVIRLHTDGLVLEPAPLTPDTGAAFDLVGGTIKHVFPGAVVVPSAMTAFTDTQFYWDLSKNIYRFAPASMAHMLNYHTVDERIHIDAHLSMQPSASEPHESAPSEPLLNDTGPHLHADNAFSPAHRHPGDSVPLDDDAAEDEETHFVGLGFFGLVPDTRAAPTFSRQATLAFRQVSSDPNRPAYFIKHPSLLYGRGPSSSSAALDEVRRLCAPIGPDIPVRALHQFTTLTLPSLPFVHPQRLSAVFDSGRAPALAAGIVAHCTSYIPEIRPLHRALWQQALLALEDEYRQPRLRTLQLALLILTSRPSENVGQREIGLARAVGCAHLLGLHMDASAWALPAWEVCVRTRIWWTLFIHDKWPALLYGRPSNLYRSNYNVPLPSVDDDASSASFLATCRLTLIVDKLLERFFSVHAITSPPGELTRLASLECILADLEAFEAALPVSLHSTTRDAPTGVRSLQLSLCGLYVVVHRTIIEALAPTGVHVSLARANALAACGRLAALVVALTESDRAMFWMPYSSHHISNAVSLLVRLALAHTDGALACTVALVENLGATYAQTQWDIAESALRRIAVVLAIGSRDLPALGETYRSVADVLGINVGTDEAGTLADKLLESFGVSGKADWLDADLSWLDSAMLLGALDSTDVNELR
ncbi:hypothetical protein CcaverHIS631_0207160 [Cutaneotrichosporon cavernicola]|nr:hypothetical protein CcaverHIS631_0207160 [Cutaneotrichosporon cavernicola]